MNCQTCGMHLTRPSSLTLQTHTCRKCRYEIKHIEAQKIKELSTIIDNNEPTGYEKGDPMPTSQEITIKEPPEKLTGELATIEMEKRADGIFTSFHSPMIQNYILHTLQQETYMESTSNFKVLSADGTTSASGSKYFYGVKQDFTDRYKKLATFSINKPLISKDGIINLSFLYLRNNYDEKEDLYSKKYDGMSQPERLAHFMKPNEPIQFCYQGVQTNDQLDEYLAKLKEIIYKIYTDNLASYNKRITIKFSEE